MPGGNKVNGISKSADCAKECLKVGVALVQPSSQTRDRYPHFIT